MQHIRIYVHLIWGTKGWSPLLDSAATRKLVWNHIAEHAASREIKIVAIGGHAEHCHCLVSLSPDQAVSRIISLMRVESQYWINRYGLCRKTFEWGNDCLAISVSEASVGKVRDFILRQEAYHQTTMFIDEVETMMRVASLTPMEGRKAG
jgi:putative transposase